MRAWIFTSLLIQLIKSLLDNRTRGSQSPASDAVRSSAAILVIVGVLNVQNLPDHQHLILHSSLANFTR